MDRPAIIDMNPVDLKYYPFMISLNTCTGSCNILSPKICVPKETKDINVKAFNIKKKKCDGSCNVLSPEICVPKETKDINPKKHLI